MSALDVRNPFQNVIEEQLVETILPNLDKIPGLETHVGGFPVLKRLTLETGASLKDSLWDQQNLVIFSDNDILKDSVREWSVKVSLFASHNRWGMILGSASTGLYLSLVIDPIYRRAFYLTPDNIPYRQIRNAFSCIQPNLKNYAPQVLRVPEINTNDSLSHAYLNAMVVKWGLNNLRTEVWDVFKSRLPNLDVLLKDNAVKFSNYLDDHSCVQQTIPQEVDEVIQTCAERLNTLPQTVSCIEDELNIICNAEERQYILSKYIECSTDLLLNTIKPQLEASTDIQPLTQRLKQATTINDIADVQIPIQGVSRSEVASIHTKIRFAELDHFKLLANLEKGRGTSVTTDDENVLNITTRFLGALESAFPLLFLYEQALDLLDTLDECLVHIFLMSGNEQPEFRNIQTFLDNTKHCDAACFNKVREALTKSITEDEMGKKIESNLNMAIEAFLTENQELSPTCKDGRIVFRRKFLAIKTIELTDPKGWDEIHIIADTCLKIDRDFHLPGKNIVIVSPEVYVTKPCIWDVSGSDAKDHRTLTPPKDAGSPGSAGLRGNPGESGGSVTIFTDKFVLSENLKIITNGGKGGNGQDGADGANGEDGMDGKGLSLTDFKESFPVCWSGLMGKGRTNFANQKDVPLSSWEHGGEHGGFEIYDHRYVEKMIGGNKVTAGHLDWVTVIVFGFLFRQRIYCFHHGTKGTPGGRGGDGGRGGKAGKGGFPGQVSVVHWSKGHELGHNMEIERYLGDDGTEGKDGKGGEAGKYGEDGHDNARLEYGTDPTVWKHGKLKLVYVEEEGPGKVWCRKNKKYASAECVENDAVRVEKLRKHAKENVGQRGESLACGDKTVIADVTRKTAVVETEIRCMYKGIGVKRTDVSKVNDDLEKLTSSLKKPFRQTRIKIKTHHIYTLDEEVEVGDEDAQPDVQLTDVRLPTPTPWTNEIKQLLQVHIAHRYCQSQASNEKRQDTERTHRQLFQSVPQMFTRRSNDCCKQQRQQQQQKHHQLLRRLLQSVPTMFTRRSNDSSCKQQQQQKQNQQYQLSYRSEILRQLIAENEYAIVACLSDMLKEAAREKGKALISEAAVKELIEGYLLTAAYYIKSSKKDPEPQCFHCLLECFNKDMDKIIDMIDDRDKDTTDWHCIITKSKNQNAYLEQSRMLETPVSEYKKRLSSSKLTDEKLRHCLSLLGVLPFAHKELLLGVLLSQLEKDECKVSTMPIRCILNGLIDFIGDEGFLVNSYDEDCVKLNGEDIPLHQGGDGTDKEEPESDAALGDDRKLGTAETRTVEAEKRKRRVIQMIIMLASNPPSLWLKQYVIMNIDMLFEREIAATHEDQVFIHECIQVVEDENVLLLCMYLTDTFIAQKTKIAVTDLVDVCKLLKLLKLNEQRLEKLRGNLDIEHWKNYLQYWFILASVNSIDLLNSEEKNRKQLTGLALELENVHGMKVVEGVFEKLRQCKQGLTVQHVLSVLQNLISSKISVNEPFIATERPEECRSSANGADDKERDIETVVTMMMQDANNSPDERTLRNVQDIIEECNKCLNQEYQWPSRLKEMKENRKISEFNEEDIMMYRDLLHEKLIEVTESSNDGLRMLLPELLAVIDRGVQLKRGFRIRDTQKLAIVILFVNESGLLEQVSTGEGKSLIVAVFAILKCLTSVQGNMYIDVITSSNVLARRDAADNADLFKLFGISVSHNCAKEGDEKKQAYKNQVVYGDLGSFQRDYLLDRFYGENILGNRNFSCVVIDEVDSMILDKGQNVLYLSHTVPNLDELMAVFVNIWEFSHARDANIKNVMSIITGLIDGVVTLDEIETVLKETNESENSVNKKAKLVWSVLQANSVIDNRGRMINRQKIEDNSLSFEDMQLTTTEKRHVRYVLRQAVLRERTLKVPLALKDFVWQHLEAWVKNAFQAQRMVEGDHYIVDVDRSEDSTTSVTNVIIMDKDTGTEQYNSQWGEGLHQFLQLKHGCRVSFESLKAVFISNVKYINLYGKNIFGLTGTLGSRTERDSLQTLYMIDHATVPTFKPSKFKEMETLIAGTTDEWISQLQTSIATELKTRPVLLICENIKTVEKMKHALKADVPIHVYTHSYDTLDDLQTRNGLDSPCLIIATNLAGRGTDLKISQKVEKAGGLHVCLSFLPTNRRLEEQAFGRAARKGQAGSGQMVILHEDTDIEGDIILLRLKRNRKEGERVLALKTDYETTICREEKLMDEFTTLYKSLAKNLKGKRDVTELVLDISVDMWAFWLDGVNAEKYEGKSDFKTNFSCRVKYVVGLIAKHMSGITCDKAFMKDFDKIAERLDLRTDSIAGIATHALPAHQIKLGKALAKAKEIESALKIFDSLIKYDPEFAECAHYYKGYAMIRNDLSIKSKKEEGEQITKVIKELQLARNLLQNKVQLVANMGHVAEEVISNTYKGKRRTFLASNGFKEQRQDLISIYNIFVNSIDRICGQPIDRSELAKLIADQNDTDEEKVVTISQPFAYHDAACHLETDLLDKKLIEPPTVHTQFASDSKAFEDVRRRYCYDAEAIQKRTNELIQKEHVKPEDYSGILPSRETFWNILENSSLITNERIYYALDQKELQNLDSINELNKSNIEEAFKQFSGDPFCSLETRHACMTSRDISIEKIIKEGHRIVEKGKLDQMFGEQPSILLPLKEKEIIIEIKLASLKDGIRQYKIHADHFIPDSFTVINGINEETSRMIYDALQRQGYMKGLLGDVVLLRKDFELFQLDEYFEFLPQILELLNRKFIYQWALDAMLVPKEEKKEIREGGREDEEREQHQNIHLVPDFLPFEPHVGLFTSLQDLNIISYLRVTHNKAIDIKKALDKSAQKDFLRKLMDRNSFSGKQVHVCFDKIREFLKAHDSEFRNYDDADVKLADLGDRIEEPDRHRMLAELQAFSSNGLGHIIELEERKWSFAAKIKMVVIAIIGVVQITLAIILEVVTVGAATMIASGLISEGIGDILFAIECAARGNCTFKDYAQHKFLALVFTVITCGIGGWFTKGTSAILRFGSRYGVTGSRLFCSLAQEAGENLARATAKSLTKTGIGVIIEKAMKGYLENVSERFIGDLKKKMESHVIRETISRLAKQHGTEKANDIINQATQKATENITNNEAYKKFCKKALSAFPKALGMATNLLKRVQFTQQAGILKQLSQFMINFLKRLEGSLLVNDFLAFSKEYTNDIEALLRQECTDESEQQHSSDDDVETLFKESCEKWQNQLSTLMISKLKTDVVSPCFNKFANKITTIAEQQLQEENRSLRDRKHERQFRNLIEEGKSRNTKDLDYSKKISGEIETKKVKDINERYEEKVTKLIWNCQSPELLAAIIKGNVPIPLNFVGIVAKATGKAVIVTEEGTGRFHMFGPASAESPVQIVFEKDQNGNIGLYRGLAETHNDAEASPTRSKDCLLEAFRDAGVDVTRDNLAHAIVQDEKTREYVESGLHRDYIHFGL